ncbi:MAG: formylglycine-generating enzyme family protein [Treponema sp.]|nr:formylglycine-generating enzyme family protein [Treponema sp.]
MRKNQAKILTILFIGTLILQSAYSQVQNEMIHIQGGTFLMGSPEDEAGRHMTDESPQHRVTVSSFYIAKFPVTQAEYLEIMGVNPSQHRGAELPADRVSWNDAIEYCNKRSIAEGLTPVYTIEGTNVTWNRQANGYRLPTEAEWEYACRAGTQTPFYSGSSMEDAGWHRDNSITIINGSRSRSTFPVGQKQPNAWGLYDMHGNVLEWCWDWFGSYTAEPKIDPAGSASSPRGARVYRGGCFDFQASWCRSSYRFGNRPAFRMFYTGFRVARNASE